MMSMVDSVTIGIETPMIDSGCSLDKEFTKLIRMNPWILFYQIVNQIDSCYGYVHGPLTWDTKDILWMDDRILIMTYKSLAMTSPKPHRLDTS